HYLHRSYTPPPTPTIPPLSLHDALPISVTVAFNRDRSRAAFRLSHPKGNILTREMVQALQSALESIEPNPHLKLITIEGDGPDLDRKSTRLNSSHEWISYAVFCLKKKTT